MKRDGPAAQLRGESQRLCCQGRLHDMAGGRRAKVDLPDLADIHLRWYSRGRAVHVFRHDIGLVAICASGPGAIDRRHPAVGGCSGPRHTRRRERPERVGASEQGRHWYIHQPACATGGYPARPELDVATNRLRLGALNRGGSAASGWKSSTRIIRTATGSALVVGPSLGWRTVRSPPKRYRSSAGRCSTSRISISSRSRRTWKRRSGCGVTTGSSRRCRSRSSSVTRPSGRGRT